MRLAAIAVLLVALPALFLIAHHVPLLVARRTGRRHGLVRIGSAADRALPRLRHLVIEVEQVLTTGQLVVVDVAPLDEKHQQDLRWFAGALARGSAEDPVARAIARLSGRGVPTGVVAGPAHTLEGAVDRHPVRFGVNGVGGPVGTTVRVDVDLRPMGHITVADEVRKEAVRCLASLRASGVEPVLAAPTLDDPDAKRVAEEVNVAQVHAGVGAATVAATLPRESTGVLRAAGTDAETILPAVARRDTVVRCTSPGIEAAVEALRQVRLLRRARISATVGAAVVSVAALAVVAVAALSPSYAALAALAGALLVAVVGASVVLLAPPPSGGTRSP